MTVVDADADRLVLWWCGGGFILPLAFLRWSGTRWRRGGSFPFLSLAHSAHGVFPTLSPFCLFPFLACLISKLIFPPSLVQTRLNSFISSLGTAAAILLHCFVLNFNLMIMSIFSAVLGSHLWCFLLHFCTKSSEDSVTCTLNCKMDVKCYILQINAILDDIQRGFWKVLVL